MVKSRKPDCARQDLFHSFDAFKVKEFHILKFGWLWLDLFQYGPKDATVQSLATLGVIAFLSSFLFFFLTFLLRS